VTWAGKTQSATSRSTPEAELVSASDCVFDLALPVQETISQLAGVTLPIELGIDADAPRLAILSGYSRKLGYVRRHQRVSLSALHEVFSAEAEANPDGNRIYREASARMPVDLFTKALGVEAFERCCQELGMGRFRDGPPRVGWHGSFAAVEEKLLKEEVRQAAEGGSPRQEDAAEGGCLEDVRS